MFYILLFYTKMDFFSFTQSSINQILQTNSFPQSLVLATFIQVFILISERLFVMLKFDRTIKKQENPDQVD